MILKFDNTVNNCGGLPKNISLDFVFTLSRFSLSFETLCQTTCQWAWKISCNILFDIHEE